MTSSLPVILSIKPNTVHWPPVPETVTMIETAALVPTKEITAMPWDYIHIGIDCRILDGRVFEIAREYLSAEKPDMLVWSSPGRRLPTGTHRNPAHIYECLCHMAKQGTLYALGNKLLSRELWLGMESGTQTARLTQALLRMKKILLLSHPWVEVDTAPTPSDDEFFALVNRYAAQGERTWM